MSNANVTRKGKSEAHSIHPSLFLHFLQSFPPLISILNTFFYFSSKSHFNFSSTPFPGYSTVHLSFFTSHPLSMPSSLYKPFPILWFLFFWSRSPIYAIYMLPLVFLFILSACLEFTCFIFSASRFLILFAMNDHILLLISLSESTKPWETSLVPHCHQLLSIICKIMVGFY